MCGRIPTQLGDVLILRTTHSFTVHVVGRVCMNAQQDFASQRNLKCLDAQTSALAEAKAIAVPGGRIFMRNMDTGEWCEMPAPGTTFGQAS